MIEYYYRDIIKLFGENRLRDETFLSVPQNSARDGHALFGSEFGSNPAHIDEDMTSIGLETCVIMGFIL